MQQGWTDCHDQLSLHGEHSGNEFHFQNPLKILHLVKPLHKQLSVVELQQQQQELFLSLWDLKYGHQLMLVQADFVPLNYTCSNCLAKFDDMITCALRASYKLNKLLPFAVSCSK
jgi:hypothetical protein